MPTRVVPLIENEWENQMLSHYKKKPLPKLRPNPRLKDGVEVLDTESAVPPLDQRRPTINDLVLMANGHKPNNFSRQEFYDPYDSLSDDDFGDDLDAIPPSGISQYELEADSSFKKAVKEASEKRKKPKATKVADDLEPPLPLASKPPEQPRTE